MDDTSQFQTERTEHNNFYTEIFIFLADGPLRHWSAHRITIARHDIGVDGKASPPEPHLSLVGFGGGLDGLPRYIESLREVERQARALREEKHAEYQAWRESLAARPA